ncbi:alpha/beta-hydrolase [Aaosphaeria arxii CBS 175.79]|uniref:Alpha/beta-hydrolase n=1 Tax=Aaosphaeria arxii CBS 175.79 TaxID=1450172 RepID=A0A6A5XR45_9PLEO|nr:alpha/beta-hydrolase [Aaosphaeria arxii CBS 175.79]KAF2015366.1 alpha/beta-hydrolase [Aaosphaeria arxii CBS 175.79]
MPSIINGSSGFVQVSIKPTISIFYSVRGLLDGTKPIILLSSSLAANTHLWDDFVEAFETEYTIITYDARFHGQSPLCSDPNFDYSIGHTMEELTNDVVMLLDHLKVNKVAAFVGLSIGAAVGLIFGAMHPERVDRVLVVGTRATSNPDSNANHTTRINFGYKNGPNALGRQSIARWFDEDWTAANPGGIAHAEKVYCHQSIEGYEASIAALRVLDLNPYAEEIGKKGHGAKFVFIAGELDGTVPQESQALADKTGSNVIVVPVSGHITPIQMPEIFHGIVRKAFEA